MNFDSNTRVKPIKPCKPNDSQFGWPGGLSMALSALIAIAAMMFVAYAGCDRAEVAAPEMAATVVTQTEASSVENVAHVVVVDATRSNDGDQQEKGATSEPAVLPFDDAHIDSADQEPEERSDTAPPAEQEPGVLEKANQLFGKAKSKGAAAAKGTGKWVQDAIGSAAESSGQAAEDSMEWANDTFQSLKEKGLTTANDTSEWLSEDWSNMDRWEYKIVDLSGDNAGMAEEMNELGKQGWECFHVKEGSFYFKKPSHSFLRSLPFKDVIKLVPLMGMGGEEGR